MATGEAEDGALVTAGLRPLEGEQRLRDAQGVRERNADAAGADVEAEPGLLLCGHPAHDNEEG
jgi:hypothetical protein